MVTTTDLIGLYDRQLSPILRDGVPMRVSVNVQSKLMSHPLENGSQITDHAVKIPTEITLSFMLVGAAARDAYQRLRGYYDSKDQLVVQTRADVYRNMVIEQLPHDESAEVIGAFPVNIKLKEVLIATTQFQALPPQQVATPRDASTVRRGQQSPRAEPADKDGKKRSSILHGIFYG